MLIGARAHSIEEAETIGKAGFPYAEITISEPETFYARQLPELRRLQQDHGISYLAHGPEEGNAWEPDELRRRLLPTLLELIDCLHELVIPLLTIHFWLDSRFIARGVIEEKIAMLGELAARAAACGVQLCIENLSERSCDLLPAFNAVEGLGLTLDVGHGQLLSRHNTAYDFTECCFERIRHLHLHDNRGGDSPRDDLHLPLGDGVIDFASILTRLLRKGFDGTMTLEVHPDSAAASREALRGMLDGM